MEFEQVVKGRHMVRDFDEEPLAPEVVTRLVSNGVKGPSAGFTQGVELLVLEGGQETGRYWNACFPAEHRSHFRWPGVMRAPLLIVVFGNESAYRQRYAEPDKASRKRASDPWPAPWWHVDAAFAAMLILLTAVDEGLGALFFAAFEPDALAAEFSVPPDYVAVGVLAIGHPRSHTPSPSAARGRRPPEEVVHRGQW